MTSPLTKQLNQQASQQAVVIKIGGAALAQPERLQQLFQHVEQELKRQGRPWLFVHGGGDLIDDWLTALGQSSQKIKGQRQTPAQHLPFVVGALAGYSNKELVSLMQQVGIPALGTSLVDGVPLPLLPVPELLCVGRPDWSQLEQQQKAHRMFLQLALQGQYVPVISSIGCLANGQLVNVNADLAAAAVAFLFDADVLLLSDVDAVLDGQGQPIKKIYAEQGESLLAQDFVQGGMQVKLQAALAVAARCRRRTAIANWQKPEQVIALLQGAAVGTQIYPFQD